MGITPVADLIFFPYHFLMDSYQTNPEYLAFLETVRTNPHDDAPRLILADWLDDHDQDSRAEFIRVQIASSAQGWSCDRFADMKGCDCANCQDSKLMQRVPLREWFRHGRTVAIDQIHVIWIRGFPMEVHLTCGEFMKCAADLFSRHPIVKVVLTDKESFTSRFPWYPMSADYDSELSKANHPESDIPLAIFEKLDRDVLKKLVSLPDHSQYDPLANDALSDACIAHGRSIVGLPPLK